MQFRELNWAVPAGSDNAIALNQQPANGASFNLNGATGNGSLASGDVTNRSTGGCSQRQIVITCASDETGHSVILTGVRAKDAFSKNSDAAGATIVETVALGSPGTFTTLQDFAKVTSAVMVGAAAGNIKIGTNGVARTPWQVPQLDMLAPFAIGLCATLVSGSGNAGIQHTLERIPHFGVTANSQIPAVYDHSSIKTVTGSTDGNYAFPISAFRLIINSGTGVWRLNFAQAGVVGGQ